MLADVTFASVGYGAFDVAIDLALANALDGIVGATYPQELAEIRAIVGDLPFLVPGIGAQGGDVEAAVKAGRTADGIIHAAEVAAARWLVAVQWHPEDSADTDAQQQSLFHALVAHT